ncbi:signal transduction histidine-protein kinase/phosphatase DegS [bacterium BMS3Abin02]|nr:signal transduction histidine-protein kinase/phosphatase DegS [bacterium BMS3Abin02]GBE22328.1 signal transduction histidine-protein kinase/phosphatase DegS [bacterium BMS3Bbin01]HDH24888.1 HAMP domain-containing protein [Actinomycetota bacterium]
MTTRTADPSGLERYAGQTKQLLGAVSVRTKILGIVLALTTVLGLGITWQVRAVLRQVLIGELDSRGRSMASDIAGRSVDPLLLDDTLSLHDLLADTVAHHPDALYAYVVDPSGNVVAHTFGVDGFPTQLFDIHHDADGESIYESSEGTIHEFSAPIFDGRAGTARVGLSETRLQNVINAITGQMLLTTLVVALVGIAAAIFLTWILTRPILDLVQTTRKVGSGDLAARARRWAKDEIGVLADAFNHMVNDLQQSQATIDEKEAARTRLLEQLITAQEEERKRIARELHDDVGQALNSLTLGISALALANGTEDANARASELRAITDETLQTVRQLGRDLRPSVLDDLGLAEALRNYAADFRSTYPEFSVDTHFDLTTRLQSTVEIALYRMVQEGMTNAARHSHGRTISVLVTQRNGLVQAIIEDDGVGFDVNAMRRSGKSVGIHSISERADLLGGRVRFESGSGGTSVYIEVPT